MLVDRDAGPARDDLGDVVGGRPPPSSMRGRRSSPVLALRRAASRGRECSP
ncbi:MAG: hypothetical protein MZV49_22290 [Rhodopseudomonas palustris]|nr:hypothetical protein [Rhodopseudomonas palustris]